MAIVVLLVEDNPGDVRLTREAFRDSQMDVALHVASDGVEAMRFLLREGNHADAPRPDLIITDLNLPRKNGREVLAMIKGNSGLKCIPTVILTTSDAESDIVASYDLQANCYLRKPAKFDEFAAVVRKIYDFWFNTVKLPHNESN